jgi:hypothetical protein
MVLKKISANVELKRRLEDIVPINSCIDGSEAVVYELTDDGGVEILSTYKNLPSDENYLNKFLEQSNDEFSQLLDIEDEL